jgi:hypothetical protein
MCVCTVFVKLGANMRLLTNSFKKCFLYVYTDTHKMSYTCARGHMQRVKVPDGNITMGVTVPKLMNSTEFRGIYCVEINFFQYCLVSDLKYSVS